MRGSSLASLEAVRNRFEPVLVAAGKEAATLGGELFAVVDALDSTGSLRRALTDPARDAADKARLVTDLLGGKVDERTVAVVADAAGSRWSAAGDLADALEKLGVEAVLADAENDGALPQVADELFAASRVLIGQPQVREALAEHRSTPQAREQLVAAVFGQSLHPDTLLLVQRAAGHQRGGNLVPVIQRYSDAAAERRNRTVAHVVTSHELSAEQVERLSATLARAYGREIQVDVALEPGIVGGLRIQVGPDVVDATVLSRLADVRRKIAS